MNRLTTRIPKGFLIVDPHVHYWNPTHFKWLAEAKEAGKWIGKAARTYGPEDYLSEMEAYNVIKTVHIQANWTDSDPVGETEYEQNLADNKRNKGHPHGIVSYMPLHKPKEAEIIMERHLKFENFRGVRFMLDYDSNLPEYCQTDKDYLEDGEFLKGLKMMEDHRGLIFDMQLCQTQLTRAADMVAKFPDLNFALNHTGFPLKGRYDEWKEGMKVLAQNENVYVKISGLGMWEEALSSVDEILPLVEETVDAFGHERCMFASNMPVDGCKREDNGLAIFDTFYEVASNRMKLEDKIVENMFCYTACLLYKI
ncbi:hypothetical protein AAMO2058_000618600 [Amorphochlora amoebiformis]